MKLHLPVSLRASLLALFGIVAASYTVQAASMHSAVTLVTYTDFGQNCGRYIAGDGGNALLQYIRQQEGGIAITYTNGMADYVISNEQGMIDFSAGYNRSIATAISPTITVTVGHNGEQSSNFTSDVYGIGGSHCINYKSVSISGSSVFSNAYNDGRFVDYRISRQSKIFTDITPAQACSSTQEARDLVSGTNMFYHSGAGYHQYPGLSLPYQAYVYETGGIIDPLSLNDTSAGGLRVGTTYNGVNNTNPLPYAALAGDSGSPVYVYDAEEGVYKFWGCTALSDGTNATYLSYTNKYLEAMGAFNRSVDMSTVAAVDGSNTVYLNAVDEVVGTQSDGSNSTTLYAGKIMDAAGNVLTTHIGLQNGLSTWSDLSGVKNNQNWYNYGNGYVAQNNADLYFTENLLFSSSAARNAVVLNATVDLGVGYAEFSASGSSPVSYTVSSASGGNYMLNSAGYLVNENVSLHLQLTSSDTHMYEWRKIGAGDLYIEGSGDNNILLNLGGSGTTYLKRTGGGYAAYNVLVNNGARVVIDDIGQIERDFTFGNKGGVLDMNGQSMDWYTTSSSETIADAGFTINALTEDAIIANNKGSSTLVYRQGGETTFLGSFRDSSDSSLKIQYAGGGTWVLNSVYTHLQNDNSGLQVDNGKVVLQGTNTIHAAGSANGSNTNRYSHADDWHYSDAAMDVTVKGGATFELGSHARLTGDVTVEAGGTYVMREGVTLSQEYVEGGQRLEDTSKYAAYYGHKGNTNLAANATLVIAFSEGTTATNAYNGNIIGDGNVTVDTAQGVLLLGGESTFTGTKALTGGGLIATSSGALGDTTTNNWVVGEDAWIASHAGTPAELLTHVDTSSTGTLVLSGNQTTQLELRGYDHLYLGAEAGLTVQYGTLGTSEELNAVNGAWRLGGGGGTLVVNYALKGAYDLMLGATENSVGTVHLTNTANDFSGQIIFGGEGVLLTYVDGALGQASVALDYGNSLQLLEAKDVLRVSQESQGMVLVDGIDAAGSITMNSHPELALGASRDVSYSGTISVAENQAYRLGAINGATLTLTSTLDSAHDVVVDAQGGTGGSVVLANTSELAGNVTVQGNKNAGAAGDITLVLGQDTRIGGSLTLQNGGSLELAGNDLTVQGSLNGSGTLRDSSSAADTTLVLASGTGTQNVSLNLNVANITKNGSGTLNLSSSDNNWTQFRISDGTVKLLANNALAANGTTYVGAGACLDLNTPDNTHSGSNIMRTTHGSIVLEEGASLSTGATATDDFTQLTGSLSVAAGGTASISGNHLRLSAAENNIGGGTMALNLSSLRLNETYAQHIGGTVDIRKSMELHSGGSASDMVKQFDHLQVNRGVTLNVHDLTWNTIWRFDKLTGEGDITWSSDTTHDRTARMILDGDGDYSGTISVNRTFDASARRYQAYLQVDAERAISGAVVNLTGSHTNANISLALNDDRVQMGGLKGNAYSHVLAGEAVASSASTSAPASTRSSTLVIGGSGSYTFSGTVGHSNDTLAQCISLEMNGTGSQSFNGSSVVVGNVAALQGSLNINPTGTLTVLGDISVAQGAALQLGAEYTLETGHTLNVLGSEAGGSAVFNSGLVMAGGIIHFETLSSTAAALAVNGSVSAASDASGVTLTFADRDAIQLGTRYLLASGDWSAMAGKITLFTPEMYKTMTLVADAGGLGLQLDMKEQFSYWEGDNAALQPGKGIVFTGGTGSLAGVVLNGAAQAEAAVFENTGDFTIGGTDGSTLSFNEVEKYKSGALIVDAEVSINSMKVDTGFALGGIGTLAVDSLSGQGTLQVQENAHLQVEAAEGVTLHLHDGSTLTTTGTTLDSGLILGDNQRTSHVNLDIQGESLSLNGAVSVQGNTSMAVQGTGVLNYNAALNNLAELQLSETSGLNVATTLTTRVAQNGATVTVQDGGVWQVAADRSTLDGDVVVNAGGQLAGADLVTENTMTVAGNVSYDSLVVQNGGKLVMQNGGALDASQAATIANGGTLELNGVSFTSKAEVTNGGVVNAQGATIASGAEIIATSGTGTLSAGTGTLTVNGLIGASAGATLRLEGNEVRIYSANINTGGGVLELAGNTYLGYLTAYATQNIGGTLNVVQNSTLHTEQGDPSRYQNITHNINHLHISNGKKLTITDSTNDWNHIYNISLLTGEGEIEWVGVNRWFDNTPSGPSRLVLSGENSFKGSLLVNQWDNHGSMQHVSLAHDYAAKNMVINMWGDSNSRPGLAISTQNAHVAGIGGTTNTFVYAGEIRSYGNGANPTSTALNTLTINTAGQDHTYNGTILGDASYGLHLVKDGDGSQTFTNSANVVHDVTVLQGNLEFTTAPTVHGDVSIAQGAELTLGSGSYSLNAGQTLNVLAGEGSTPAVLNNSLVLNGGSLQFGAYDSTTAVLSTQGVSLGSDFTTLNVLFGNTMSIREGSSYLLASGDWSALAGKLTCDTGEYLTATLGATSSGLQVTFALADGYSVWRGDERMLQAGSKVLFGCLGGSNEVVLSASASIDAAYFDNLSDVTVSSANGASLTANIIEKHGIGALVINNTVNGDTLRVAESSLLTGSGRLAVDTVEISRGAQASISKLTLAVESAITGDGVLHMGQDSTLQVGSSVGGNVQLTDGSTLVAADSSVSTNLTLGANGADSRVSLRMGNSSGVALNGSIAVQGNTTLSVQGSGALQFNSAFNRLAALELQTGVNLSLSSEMSTHLVLDGGSASLSGNDNKILDGDVTVKNGGALTFTGTGADIMDYNMSGKTLTVSGGTIDFGSTRQTMGSWTLQLSNGAVLTGAGNATHGAMDFNVNNSTIYATSGSSSISAVTRLRNGNNLNYDVSDDATLTISGRHHSSGSDTMGSITKLGGGVLVLSGDALSLLTSASYVAVDEGTLDLSAAGSSANLSRVSGAGTVVLNYGMNGNGSGFDFSGLTGEVELRSGRIQLNASTFGDDCPDFLLTSSNSQLVFNGNGTVVNSNVHVSADTTDFHVNSGKSGTIGGDITGNSLIKRGAGSLTIGGNMKLGSMLTTHAGEVILTGEDNSVANVDGAMENGNTAEGKLRLAQDARLQVTGNIWGRSNTGIHLDSGAELNISGQSLSISNRAEEGTASLAATTSTGPGEYNINRTNYQISNAHVTYTGGNATINNRLTNSAIENAGNGILKVNNAENSLSAVHATGGSIKLFSADELDLEALEVAASLSVSAYCQLSEQAAAEARINVSGMATFGTDVTLNADLVMKSGATLNIAGPVQMGSDVRLESGLQLAGAQFDTLSSLRVGEKVTLFSGVDSLFLGNSTVASDAITLNNRVLASEYFSNLSDSYFLIYDISAGIGQGELSIAVVPEPATTTLGILALAGLAARRRRK